jgi:iron(III) transport system substrate-binding protein
VWEHIVEHLHGRGRGGVRADAHAVLGPARGDHRGARSPADVFFTENSNCLQQLDDQRLLAKVAPSTLGRVPGRDSAGNGGWLGVSGRYSVMIYNPSKISASQMPTSALDLADPRYKGKLELAPDETGFWPVLSSIARAKGSAAAAAWLKGIKSNAGSDDHTPDNETLVGDVSAGHVDPGLGVHRLTDYERPTVAHPLDVFRGSLPTS